MSGQGRFGLPQGTDCIDFKSVICQGSEITPNRTTPRFGINARQSELLRKFENKLPIEEESEPNTPEHRQVKG